MKFVLFYHSILSCWNHGNVHFLRGVCRELIRLGHQIIVCEPEDGWSRLNALADGGENALAETANLIPGLVVRLYRPDRLDIDEATDNADIVIAHEWNTPALIAALGQRRRGGARYRLLFHDTHHRAVTAPHEMSRLDLDGYDGVLAFGEVLRDLYRRRGWGRCAFVWHEAADTALFRPLFASDKDCDLIWIGNWGDEERTRELDEFVFAPVRKLAIRTHVYGVRYPTEAHAKLSALKISHRGWLPNHRAPAAFARAHLTVHVPRRPYTNALPGIPTIRVFEALACGIPLVCAPWDDCEDLFPSGAYLRANDRSQMTNAIARILLDRELACDLRETGLRTIRERHTCKHRVHELLAILKSSELHSPRLDASSLNPAALVS